MIPGNRSLRKTCTIAPAGQASARSGAAGLMGATGQCGPSSGRHDLSVQCAPWEWRTVRRRGCPAGTGAQAARPVRPVRPVRPAGLAAPGPPRGHRGRYPAVADRGQPGGRRHARTSPAPSGGPLAVGGARRRSVASGRQLPPAPQRELSRARRVAFSQASPISFTAAAAMCRGACSPEPLRTGPGR